MNLYNKEHQKTNFTINPKFKLGTGSYGSVYKIDEKKCIKIYKYAGSVQLEMLQVINDLNLPNYYKILDFYYNKNNIFKAHTMKYYSQKEIDILTMPVEYSLDNITVLLSAVNTLTSNNILICDMHTENIIMNDSSIIIIDTDLYTFNKYFNLEIKNLSALTDLYLNLYLEAIINYHPEYDISEVKEIIYDIYNKRNTNPQVALYEEIRNYKYPIDYIKKRVK